MSAVVHAMGGTPYDALGFERMRRSMEWRARRGALIGLILLVGLLPVHGARYVAPHTAYDDDLSHGLRMRDWPAQVQWGSIFLSGYADLGSDPRGQVSLDAPGCCDRWSLAYLPGISIIKWSEGAWSFSLVSHVWRPPRDGSPGYMSGRVLIGYGINFEGTRYEWTGYWLDPEGNW